MKYLRKFENKSDYDSSKCSINDPIISFVNEDLSCNCIDLKVIKCIYDVTDITNPTKLYSNNKETLTKVIVDGIDVELSDNTYLFDSLGYHIVEFAFGNCKSFSGISFNSCEQLISINFPENCKNSTVTNSINLSSVTFSNRDINKQFNEFTFTSGFINNNPKIEEFIFPTGYINLWGEGNSQFKSEYLKTLIFPKGSVLKNDGLSLNRYSFNGCTSLERIIFENGAEYSLNSNNFLVNYTNSIKEIFIGDSVSNIKTDTFWLTTNCESIVVDNNNPYYDSRENCNCIIETSTDTLLCGVYKGFIPDSVKILKKLIISSGVTELTIPDNIETITGSYNDLKLREITFGKGLKSFGGSEFKRLRNLTKITMKSLVAPTLNEDNNIFIGCPSTGRFTYPKGSDYSSYKNLLSLASWTFVESEDLI